MDRYINLNMGRERHLSRDTREMAQELVSASLLDQEWFDERIAEIEFLYGQGQTKIFKRVEAIDKIVTLRLQIERAYDRLPCVAA